MSESDTPRTDENCSPNYSYYVLADFARTIERELGEAELNIEAIVDDFRTVKDERDQWRAVAEQLYIILTNDEVNTETYMDVMDAYEKLKGQS